MALTVIVDSLSIVAVALTLVQTLAVVAVAVVIPVGVQALSIVAVALSVVAVATGRYRLVADPLSVAHRLGTDLDQWESVSLASVYSPFVVGRIHEHRHPST